MAKATESLTPAGDQTSSQAAGSQDGDDGHRGIPRDAEGNLAYLILPPERRAKYDRSLADCEESWLATHDPSFVIEALTSAYLYRQPPTEWLLQAVIGLGTECRTKTFVDHARHSAAHLLRYETICTARREGLSWEKAYTHTAELLKETKASGKPETMKDSYRVVRADLKAGRAGKYHKPKFAWLKREFIPE
jgi:hypothetical protein